MRAHKIRLYPNRCQQTSLAQACGVARFAYNYALAQWNAQHQAGGKPNEAAICRQLNAVKRDEFPWMMDVSKCAPQKAIMQLGVAFKNFFAKRANPPQFRRKGVHERFTLDNLSAKITGTKIRLAKIRGLVRLAEPLRFTGKILSYTISRVADNWYVSVCVDVPNNVNRCENQAVVGVDLGIKTLATLSSGEKIDGPKAHTALLANLRRTNREFSRRVKGSKNRSKSARKLARIHDRIACIRKDATHKLTTRLAREFGTVVVEDLAVSNMAKNHRLARHIMDGNWHELRRQLEYKCNKVVVADRFFASSKTCSACGTKADCLPLEVRHWCCAFCGTQLDRDINAAVNLRNLAASSAVTAYGVAKITLHCEVGMEHLAT